MHSSDRFLPAHRPARVAVSLVSLLLITVAQAESPSSTGAAPDAARQPVYKTPEEASQALLSAVQGQNAQRLKELLGDSGLVETDQPELDVLERQQFAQKFGEMHRLVHLNDGSYVLQIGPENWPFPVPIVSQDGAWRFDTGAGLREVVFRRIGENEITAIHMCRDLVAAQRQPVQTQAGPPGQDERRNVIMRVLATAHTPAQPVRFHGYEYRMVTGSEGHVIAVAYPAEYRSSGVMTFVASQEDVVYEKDLGRRTSAAARALKALPPAWLRVEEEEGNPSP